MSDFVELRRCMVKVVFRARGTDGRRQRYYVRAMGRTERYASRSFAWLDRMPDDEAARNAVLGFNDAMGCGISGRGCPVKLLARSERLWIFGVEARVMGKPRLH